MPLRVDFSARAAKKIRAYDRRTRLRIGAALEEIAANPYTPQHSRPLSGQLKGKWRYRLGGLRIVYETDEAEGIVWVKAVESRGQVY